MGRLLLTRGALMDPSGVSNVARGSGTVSVTFDVPSLASGIAGSVRNLVVLIIGLSADVRLSVEAATLGTPSLIAEGGIALSAGGPLAGEPVRTSALDTLIGTAANQKFVVKIDKAGSGSMVDFTKVRDVVLGLDYGP